MGAFDTLESFIYVGRRSKYQVFWATQNLINRLTFPHTFFLLIPFVLFQRQKKHFWRNAMIGMLTASVIHYMENLSFDVLSENEITVSPIDFIRASLILIWILNIG